MVIGILVLFAVVFIIVKASQGNKSETVHRIDANGNETIEKRTEDKPTAGTEAARLTLAIIGIVIAIVLIFFVSIMAYH